jgi:hypothetical protein
MHRIDRHWAPLSRWNDALQSRRRQLRQDDHTAVGVQKELDPVAWLEVKVFANRLRYRRLTLYGECGFHAPPPYFPKKVILLEPEAVKQKGAEAPTSRAARVQLMRLKAEVSRLIETF